jgi:HK97 gp10 family phage protein
MPMNSIQGLDSWTRWVQSITPQVEQEVKNLVADTAYRIEAEAKMLVPVDTGYLRNSIKTTLDNGGFTASIGTATEYALFVEFGTSKQPAKPYLTPAYVKFKQKFTDDMNDIADRMV